MADAEPRRAATSGGEMAYLDAGEGPAVVLLHGFPASAILWRNVWPTLAGRMRVIVPDLLGYGRSEQPDGVPLNVPAQARYVRDLLAGIGVDRFAVVGHDIGGAVAQLLALDGGVDALVLMDADAFDVWPIEGVRMLQDATEDQETPEFVAGVVDLAFDLGVGRDGVLTEDVRAAYRMPWAGPAGAAAFFRAVRAIDGVGLAGREDELAALDVPALLVWGEDDPYVPVEVADRLVEVLARPSLVLLPGCSHFTPEEAPETVAPLVSEFLRASFLGAPHEHGPEHAHAAPGGPVPITLERRGPA
jgi:2-hydroxymuconate-semialdehyde hydrolase